MAEPTVAELLTGILAAVRKLEPTLPALPVVNQEVENLKASLKTAQAQANDPGARIDAHKLTCRDETCAVGVWEKAHDSKVIQATLADKAAVQRAAYNLGLMPRPVVIV